MKERHKIEKAIGKSWEKCINDYKRQLINSERCLQAALYCYLKQIISNDSDLSKKRRLFVEPGIKKPKGLKLKQTPDIIICNTKQVISIIELKYKPRGQSNYKKDIETLSLIAKNREKLSISNKRFRGKIHDDKEYLFSKKILFVWASIQDKANRKNNFPKSAMDKSLEGCFIAWLAETKNNCNPEIHKLKW